MSPERAGDVMVPIEEYPIVDASVTLLDAVIRLDESRRTMEGGRQPYQAVLVADKNGTIVGKLGQLALLRALEPRSHVVDDLDMLDRAGVGDSVMETVLGHSRVFQRELSEMCLSAAALPIRNVMRPINEHIDENSSISDVIHQMVLWQTMSILVTRDNQPVGLVRLSDLCDEVIKQMRLTATNTDNEE
jgi:hypothetical protein